nr:MAG TPA: hypothetical protein [Caudoviricetes sp.]
MSDNMHGFKAYEPGLICRGHKYEENTVYKKSGYGICVPGVTHYCVNPFDVLDHYPLVRPDGQFSDFTTVEAIDPPVTDDDKKFATSTIKIGVKLGFSGFIQACVDFLFEKTIKKMPKPEDVDVSDAAQIGSSGDDAKIGSSGDDAQIGSSGDDAKIGSSGYAAQIGSSGYAAQIGSSGDDAKIGSSGRYAKIGSSGYAAQIGSSGDDAKIGSSGRYAKIGSSGRYAKIGSSGDDARIVIENVYGVAAAIGKRGKIKAPVGTWCTLAEYGEWDGDGYPCICVKSYQVDGEIIKADVFYTLRNGEIVEAEE